MTLALVLGLAMTIVPVTLAGVAFVLPSDRVRPWIVTAGGTVNLAIAAAQLAGAGAAAADLPVLADDRWIVLDPLGKVLLALLGVLFFLCGLYVPGYLAQRPERPNRVFCGGVLVFFGMTSLTVHAQHLGLLWVALETTTLVTGPLLYFNRNPRSLEATWKYLLIGSVGIALALLGTFFLAYAALHGGRGTSLVLAELIAEAPALNKPWLHAAFVLLFVGYGTKMGLAPLHTWKPDAYGEAPGIVGALLAGGLTSCSFLALARIFEVCHAAGEAPFARRILVVMGLLSMAVAAAFLIRQKDTKRLLAYSSVEQMGIAVLGLGLGKVGVFGALLHLWNNGLAKGVSFLAAGNLHRAYGGRTTDDMRGALRKVPLSGALFLASFLAVTGSPPFGPFLSELTILDAALGKEQYLVAAVYLASLVLVFAGMGATVLSVVQGPAPGEPGGGAAPEGHHGRVHPFRDRFLTVAPPMAFLLLVTMLGLWVPGPAQDLLREAVRVVEATP